MRLALLVMLLGLWSIVASSQPAQAAKVQVAGMNAAGAAIITVTGRIEAGDGTRFLAEASRFRDAVVVLDSMGGSVPDGLTIARILNARGFTTVVPSGKLCASMCAVAWLAGRQRSAGEGARIGFHAVSDARTRAVSSNGNAVIGAYLNTLGYGFDAVSFFTAAGPKSISWLTAEKAAEFSVSLTPLTPATLAVAGPPAAPASLDLVAVTRGRVAGCEREVMVSLVKKSLAGKEELKTYLFVQSDLINRNCKQVPDATTVVIREADPALPIVCAEPGEGQRCQWFIVFQLQAEPSRTAWAAPVPLARRDDTTVCRLATLVTGRGWDPNAWSAVQEAGRRELKLETCQKLLNLQAQTSPVDAVEVCRRALLPTARGWNTEAWPSVQAAMRRNLTLGTCLTLTGRQENSQESSQGNSQPDIRQTSPPPTPAALTPNIPGATVTVVKPVIQPDVFPNSRPRTSAMLPAPRAEDVAADVEACRATLKDDPAAGSPPGDPARHGLTVDRCRGIVRMAEALTAMRASDPLDAPLRQRPPFSLCYLALDAAGVDWDARSQSFVLEAKRRGLTPASCRAALVCSGPAAMEAEPARAALACEEALADVPVEALCAAALTRDRRGWTEDPVFGFAVAEVERRKLQRGECIHFAGLSPPAE